jgi:hypothetical protein
MTVVHPITRAWITTGGTGAQNYDEFADDAEITAIIEANPHSALGIEMPHRAPESLGRAFLDALPEAAARLAEAKADGSYTPAEQVVVLYRISAAGEEPAYGLFAMVDTDQISTSADEPGLVIRNEDVHRQKDGRLAETLGHCSPACSRPARRERIARGGDRVRRRARRDRHRPGRPDARHLAARPRPAAGRADRAGRRRRAGGRRRQPPQPGRADRRPAPLPGGGHHPGVGRHPALQPAGQRADHHAEELLDRLRAAGAEITPIDGPVEVPAAGGTVVLRLATGAYAVRLPHAGGSRLENLDHALVERLLLRDALGLDPGDKRITYVGGDYPASWLTGEVDAGRAELAILIAPVTVDDFVAVNLAREKMPRKSTWFTPKARGGLVVAELSH